MHKCNCPNDGNINNIFGSYLTGTDLNFVFNNLSPSQKSIGLIKFETSENQLLSELSSTCQGKYDFNVVFYDSSILKKHATQSHENFYFSAGKSVILPFNINVKFN